MMVSQCCVASTVIIQVLTYLAACWFELYFQLRVTSRLSERVQSLRTHSQQTPDLATRSRVIPVTLSPELTLLLVLMVYSQPPQRVNQVQTSNFINLSLFVPALSPVSNFSSHILFNLIQQPHLATSPSILTQLPHQATSPRNLTQQPHLATSPINLISVGTGYYGIMLCPIFISVTVSHWCKT